MIVKRVPPFPLVVEVNGLPTDTAVTVKISDSYSRLLWESHGVTDASGGLSITLPDYFSKYDDDYSIEIFDALTSDVIFGESLSIYRPYVDLNCEGLSEEDCEKLHQLESLARAIIDSITGGFGYHRKIYEWTGLGEDYMAIPYRILKINRVVENNTIVHETMSEDPNWRNAKTYKITPDRTAITIDVQGTYNRWEAHPQRVPTAPSDSINYYSSDSWVSAPSAYMTKGIVQVEGSGSMFPMNWDYVVDMDAGWPTIPTDIVKAMQLLMDDIENNGGGTIIGGNNSYITQYVSGQYSVKFGDPNDGNSSSGTTSGNRIVDNILSKYLPSGQLGHRLGVL